MRIVLTFPVTRRDLMSRLTTGGEQFEDIMQGLHTATRAGVHSSVWILHGANDLELLGEFRMVSDYGDAEQIRIDTAAQNV